MVTLESRLHKWAFDRGITSAKANVRRGGHNAARQCYQSVRREVQCVCRKCLRSQDEALVDVDHEAELDVTLLHALHGLVHVVNVNHLRAATSTHTRSGGCWGVAAAQAGTSRRPTRRAHHVRARGWHPRCRAGVGVRRVAAHLHVCRDVVLPAKIQHLLRQVAVADDAAAQHQVPVCVWQAAATLVSTRRQLGRCVPSHDTATSTRLT